MNIRKRSPAKLWQDTQILKSGLSRILCGESKRRAVMTGLTWLSGKIAEYNAEKLGTEYFEVNGTQGRDQRIRYGRAECGVSSNCMMSVDSVQ